LHDSTKLMLAGWVHIRGEKTAYTNYYKKMKESDIAQWPPKFWKFEITTEGDPEVQIAFTDARRFGRVRLVDCPGSDIRQHSPLVENGPDPVVDTDRFTKEYLGEKMRSRHVPIKALLLDQAMISGIGNWVADETLYQAKMHPEQYCDDFGDPEVATLYESIRYVCQTAVDKLGDSDEFPEHWLFNYRWGKGGKDAASKLPNGEKLAFITVGGRTSCYAPGVQKKSGRIVPGVKVEPATGDDKAEASAKGRKKPRPKEEPKDELEAPPPKKLNRGKTDKAKSESPATDSGRRRSSRLKK
jgi:formamidopyrimidine-DNA glycosylase